MASPFWGLYEDLPPPPTAAQVQAPAVPAAPVQTAPPAAASKPDISEWTSNPMLAKMMLTTNRKKPTMIPRATQAIAKAKKAADKSQAHNKSNTTPEVKSNAIPLVSPVYMPESHPMEVEEEYDPARPNEYDKYVAERAHKIKMEKEEEMKRERDLDWDKDTEDVIPKPIAPAAPAAAIAVDLSVSGEEAFNRRARLSGRVPSPPRNVPPPQPDIDDDIDGEAMDTLPTAPPPVAVANSGPKESFAARMMAKMGWKEGSGLGKEEQGMTTALVHKKTDKGTTVIVNAPPVPQPKPRPALRFPPTSEQSKVILLKNMVGPGEVDDDLEAETASECSRHGEVIKCLIYEVVGGLVAPSEAVRIFVQFARQEAALKAYADLNGRFFGGRTVAASFFSEERFNLNDLAPSKEELETMTTSTEESQ